MVVRDRPRSGFTSPGCTRINFRHLHYAVVADDCGSFRGAAEVLRTRQSTLSRCVRQLEQTIGMTIFDRSNGGVKPTECGRTVLRAARSILEQVDALTITAKLSGRGEAGQLTIGFHTSFSAGNLRGTVLDYKHRFPKVEINMFESSTDGLARALRNGTIDTAIVTGDRTSLRSFNSAPLWSERILAALPSTHRLASKKPLFWTDFGDETILLCRRDPDSTIQEFVTTHLVGLAARPKIVLHDVTRETIQSLVSAHCGIGLMLEASIGASFAGVVHRDIQDGGGSSRIGFSAHWRKDATNPALSNFLKLLRERYPSPTI